MDFATRLDSCNGFPCIFELVKSAVKRTTGKGRVGLILGLSNLPTHIGGLHQLGSNFIIMNKKPLNAVIDTGNKKLINAYVFHILLHEYIHSLGYVNEQEVQIITHTITEDVLGPDHLATKIARYGIGFITANLGGMTRQEQKPDRGIEIVRDVETDNLNYFG